MLYKASHLYLRNGNFLLRELLDLVKPVFLDISRKRHHQTSPDLPCLFHRYIASNHKYHILYKDNLYSLLVQFLYKSSYKIHANYPRVDFKW
jgi:hypothetical protein